MAPVPHQLAPALTAGGQCDSTGRRSQSYHTGSTAVGTGAVTTRDNHTVIGTASTEVTVPNIAGEGTAIIAANEDGTLQRSSLRISITPSISAYPSWNQQPAASAMRWKPLGPWAPPSPACLKFLYFPMSRCDAALAPVAGDRSIPWPAAALRGLLIGFTSMAPSPTHPQSTTNLGPHHQLVAELAFPSPSSS